MASRPPFAADDDPRKVEGDRPPERRSSRRISLRLDVAVPVVVRSPIGVQRGVARNISEGGMLIELSELPGIGASIEITITGIQGSVDAPESVTLLGEVRHQLAWQHTRSERTHILRGVGVRFLDRAERLFAQLEGPPPTLH